MLSIKINLAGNDYEISEFTLGQLEDIQELIQSGVKKSTDRAILQVALSKDHPNITADVLRDMKLGSIRKVDEEVRKVLKFAGFKTVDEVEKDKSKGEAASA